jgi:hypothetical protein
MARKTTNLILLKATVHEAKRMLAEAGYTPLREEDVDDTRVRLYFSPVPEEDVVRFFRIIPLEMHGSKMLRSRSDS